ncbi:fatty acyl-AMP ligase [Streptomyces sp. NPDC021098]|uniref:fatty acyl-AMP ligase n=1 Tax=unclassified Streptomyces TaxID=2593676 RepID=UPI0037AAB121
MEALDQHALPSLLHLLYERARTQPDRLAYRFLKDGTSEHAVDWTYGELAARADSVAADLESRGLSGGRIILALAPGLDYVAGLFGILRAGCTAVPSFPPFGRRATSRFLTIVEDCAPVAVLTDAGFAGQVMEYRQRLPESARSLEWILPDEQFVQGDAKPSGRLRAADPALLQYTSGSTGEPKGIILTHANLVANCRVLDVHMGFDADRVGCSWLPPYHDMGLMGTIMLSLYGGWPLVMLSPMHFVQDPYRWLKAITDNRVTISVGPNFAFDLCATTVSDDELATLDLSTLRQVFCGSEPVSIATLERFAERFGPACGFDLSSLIPCYGLAEATLFVSGKPERSTGIRTEWLDKKALEAGAVRRTDTQDPADATAVVSCGVIADGHQVIIVDPDSSEPLAAGRVGEIWVTGPNIAAGYLHRPDLTDRTFRARPQGRTGGPVHLRTGDLGFLLDGELFVTGRIKDLIIVSGRNLHPQDIERSVLQADALVRRTAAFSVHNPARDEEDVVVVAEYRGTPRDFTAQESDLRERVTSAVAGDHGVRLAALHFGPPGTVLMTTSGKVRRRATRDAYLAGTLSAFPPVAVGDRAVVS